jgi:hypothetical protein
MRYVGIIVSGTSMNVIGHFKPFKTVIWGASREKVPSDN